MAGKQGDGAIVAPTNLQTPADHQVELSQNVQSLAIKNAQLAAPEGKWDKFVDITEQGFKDIPAGMLHAVENPLGLIENAAIAVGTGFVGKVLLPEAGPLGKVASIGLGLYFAEQAAVPVYKAYKTGMNATTMGGINAAGTQIGDSVGGLVVNLPGGILGYKLGAGLGTSLMATPEMAGFVQYKAAKLTPINDGLSSAYKSGKAGIAGLFRSESAGALDATGEVKTAPTEIKPEGRAEGSADQLQGHVEKTENPTGVRSDAAGQSAPLPDRYLGIKEKFAGQTVPGISREYLKNLQTEQGDYYGAGLRYPDIMTDPKMADYINGQNVETFASVDKAIYAQELANEAKATSYKLPADWVGSKPPANAIDVTDGGEGSMTVGSKTFTLTDDGAPNRKLVVGGKTLIAEPKDFEIQQVIQGTANGANKFAVVGSQDGASILHVYDDAGKLQNQIQLPGYGTLHDVRQGASPSELKFLYDTPISHPQVVTLDLASGKSDLSPLSSAVFDTDKYVTDKVVVPWADREGKMQESPVFVSHAKGMVANGQNLAYYKIYGGFDVGPQYVGYSPSSASWLMNGHVAVDPVLPGDGGLGSGNFNEGKAAGIENTKLALAAIVQKLHDMGISSPETTGIYGRSNGGMEVNSFLNEHPTLVGAAVSESGVNSIFDSPVINPDTGRYWVDEFGNPRIPNQVAWMTKQDVLNNLSPDTKLPPTLVAIGTKDGVVNAGNGITYHNMRQTMGNGETRLYSRIGEGHDPVNLNLAFQSAFLRDRLLAAQKASS